MGSTSEKAREYEQADASSGLWTNLRLAIVFGLLSGLSFAVFLEKTVGVLLVLVAAVFALKALFNVFWIIKAHYFRPFTADESLFDRRVAELDEDELVEQTNLFGFPLKLIRDGKTDLADVRRVIGPTDAFLASFEDFKAECRSEHPKLAEDIVAMQIVGVEAETPATVFVYFSGAPGRLFMARFDGQWTRL